MANSDGIITAPVGIDTDIAPVLGLYNYNLGYICANTHGQIKPWARYKPVKYNSSSPADGEKWWKAVDGDCGITIKQIANYKDSVNYADGGMNGWVYSPPTDNDNFPYRVLDFDGYNHNAKPPIHDFTVPATATNKFSSSSFTASCAIMATSVEGGNTLSLDDFATLRGCYFGVYCVKQGSTTVSRRATADQPIDGGYAKVKINTYGMSTGKWDVYPFISTAVLGQNELDVANTCYSIPYAKMQTIEIIDSYITITVHTPALPSTLPTSPYFLTVTVNVTNSASSSTTFTNNYWRVRYSDKTFNDAMTVGETSGTIGDFTVSGGTTYSLSVQVQLTDALMEGMMAPVGWISLNSSNYLQRFIFMQEVTGV